MISVIVPIYNSAATLRGCIDSILNQTLTDFELLLVDDGSSDSSRKICDFYSKADSRIRTFHKKNGGAASSRNLGLDESRGEFIVFIDSDDYVYPDFLEGLMEYSTFDHVLGGIKRTPIESSFVLKEESFYSDTINRFLSSNITNGYQCGKLFRRLIIVENNIRFDTRFSVYEDLLFCLDYLYHCSSIKVVPYERYLYFDPPSKCVWDKYPVSVDVICALYSITKEKTHLLSEKFGEIPDDVFSSFHFLSHYDYSVIRKGGDDSELFELYKNYYGGNRLQFYNAPFVSPILREINRTTRECFYLGHIDIRAFSWLIQQYKCELSLVSPSSKKDKLMLFSLKKNSKLIWIASLGVIFIYGCFVRMVLWVKSTTDIAKVSK